ncbi:MAG TPA: choice-of-anchor D domain-containing protein [Blastocatellia bacterium]|nr:choice-of-anchor D domain-containing protein [Blastocatellia bacterium]
MRHPRLIAFICVIGLLLVNAPIASQAMPQLTKLTIQPFHRTAGNENAQSPKRDAKTMEFSLPATTAQISDAESRSKNKEPERVATEPSPVNSRVDQTATQAQPKPLTEKLTMETEGLTLRYPADWTVAPHRLGGLTELISVSVGKQKEATQLIAKIKITTENRLDHADAVQRLQDIRQGHGAKVSDFTMIGGWPAVQFSRREERPQPDRGPKFADPMMVRVTTAIAVGKLLLRIEGSLPSDANQELISQVEAISRSLISKAKSDDAQSEKELQQLRRNSPDSSASIPAPANVVGPFPGPEKFVSSAEAAKEAQPAPGATQRIITGRAGELEIAVSPNGRNIVIGQQSVFRSSNDGGQTFPFTGFIPFSGGDPSLAWGQSGNFYYAGIRGGCQPSDTAGPFGYTCTGMARSTNNGQTFPTIFNAVTCPNSDPDASDGVTPVANSCFPDQEHIAADRVTAGSGGDQVYSTWRNFDATDQDPGLVCSQNSGANWTLPITVGSGAFPRINVGQDGFVYVAYLDGGNYQIHKFSSCANGLVPQAGFPRVVVARAPVNCPFAGHDRCDQNPSSQTVAIDDTNPNHIYFAYAENAGANNEDILVRDSLDGGNTWTPARVVRVNTAVVGKRVMPWVCTTGGEAFVSWYDRRSATPCATPPCFANNDLTDYYSGRARLDAGGNLIAGAESKITEVADPWCAAGWGGGTRSTNDSESCSMQPQLAGFCRAVDGAGNVTGPGSGARCDFSDSPATGSPPCGVGEACKTDGGIPKYGDYNGNACAAGRLFAAWASATSPPSISPPSNSIDIFTSIKIVGNVPQIQIPSDPRFADTCVSTNSSATLSVCNTGKADLEVSSITSSNSQFAVTSPSAGFPVVVSPDFCFPFEVRFTPNSIGSKTTTLTINSNDPSTPVVTRLVSAQGEQPGIATIIADSGNFGDVCVGKFKDLKITVNNNGGCDLVITGISSSSAQFQTAGVMSFPLVVHPGDSLQIPIRFAPTSFGAKNGTITINSNDPVNPAKVISVTGNAPTATIVVNDPIVFDKTCPGNTNNKVLTIGNSGMCDLVVNSITSSSLEFKVIGVVPFPLVIPPGSTRDVTIQFMPMGFTVDPMRMATLTIVSNDLVTPNKVVKVIGTVPPPVIQAMPDPLDFGKVCLGKSKELPVTIKNNGECNLTVSSISFSSPEFKLLPLPTFPFVVPPGSSTVVMVSFMPVGATGQRMATMSINSDDPATPIKIVTLKGEAPVSDIAISGPTDWGDVTVGKFKDQIIYITNTEACDLALTLVCEVRNGTPMQASVEFNLVNPLNYPVIIPGGATLPVRIRFKPERTGPRTANLFVCGFDPQTPGGMTPAFCPPGDSNLKRTVVLTGKGK